MPRDPYKFSQHPGYRQGQTPQYFPVVDENTRTPEKQRLATVDVTTPGGSKLTDSPSTTVALLTRSPNGTTVKESTVGLFCRANQHQPRQPSMHLENLFVLKRDPSVETVVTTSPESRAAQPPRKTQPKEKSVTGKSAAEFMVNFLNENGISYLPAAIEGERYNLCHVQGYATSMSAMTSDGEVFNTQTKQNIFSATRVLNENMLRFERVILDLLKDESVSGITYTTRHAAFSNSHVLASIKIDVDIELKCRSKINFHYTFDITDNRRLPKDLEDVLKYFIVYQIENSKLKPKLDQTALAFRFADPNKFGDRKRAREEEVSRSGHNDLTL